MNYFQQLKDPRWRERRDQIIERAGHKCEYCGDEDSGFEVHHGVYVKNKMAWDYPDEVLYCLCPECHFTIQELMEIAQYEIGKRNLELYMLINNINRNIRIRTDEGADLQKANPLTAKMKMCG